MKYHQPQFDARRLEFVGRNKLEETRATAMIRMGATDAAQNLPHPPDGIQCSQSLNTTINTPATTKPGKLIPINAKNKLA